MLYDIDGWPWGGKSRKEWAVVGCKKPSKDKWDGGNHLDSFWAAPWGRGDTRGKVYAIFLGGGRRGGGGAIMGCDALYGFGRSGGKRDSI